MKKPLAFLCMTAALLALQAPAQASARVEVLAAEAGAATVQGVIQKISTGNVLLVNGKSYAITLSTVFYGGNGQRIAAPRLAEGQTIAFSLAQGSSMQIKELWTNL